MLTQFVGDEKAPQEPDASLGADTATFMQSALAPHTVGDLLDSGRLRAEGDQRARQTLLPKLDVTNPGFNIVVP